MSENKDFEAVENARMQLVHKRLSGLVELIEENVEMAAKLTANEATVASELVELTRIIAGGSQTTSH